MLEPQDVAVDRFATIPDETKWEAVCSRDRSCDGTFVFAVATTGIYCKPSCAARRPNRDNVAFYENGIDAQKAGFRACRRCKPDQPSENRSSAIVAQVCRLIEEAEEMPTLDELGSRVGLSPFHLHRLFKRSTGLTPRAYGAAKKAELVKSKLAEGAAVTHAIYAAGYGSSSRFYESARAELGMTPRAYSTGGANEEIRYAVGKCSIGFVLVAATDKGICDVRLGDEPDDLVGGLHARFSKATLAANDDGLADILSSVLARIESPRAGEPELPLDIRGTIFQQRVWAALREIPAGKTESYAEVAQRIGRPSATRAVANACGANRIAVLVPCHRVVRTDHSSGGYHWGVARKKVLLEREQKPSRPTSSPGASARN